MRQLLLIIAWCSVFQMQSQDVNLFQTWRLTYMTVELDSDVDVEAVLPIISPTLTIADDFTFEGDSGCNVYEGNFSYDSTNDTFFTNNFGSTLISCDFESHQEIEDMYIYYLTEFGQQPMTYSIDEDNDGDMSLYIDMQIPGFSLYFTNRLLSNDNVQLTNFKLYPNPTTQTINIASNTLDNYTIALFNAQGVQVFKSSNQTSLNLSSLPQGVYFAEISTEGRKIIEKIIKK